ncbi:MAG: transposase [Verrucomicrobia bacterium]|nr:transposase [Verrucomicrobiota bacterium]
MRFFDPYDRIAIIGRKLPHWSQAGTICFITWRTHDSIPKAVLEEWLADRDRWLVSHGILPSMPDWNARLAQLSPALIAEFHNTLSARWQDSLDACHGECVLRRPELAEIVSKSLLHFDGDRYAMLDFVVMPNHVHLLATFSDEEAMLAQCESWKHFMATQINKRLGGSGRFWQQDAFDHLVRHEAQFERLRQYIAENPSKAKLKAGEFVHYSNPHSSPHAPREVNTTTTKSSRGA